LLVLGLDGFQQINDCSATAGDLVLRAVSERLATTLAGTGTVAR